MGLSLVFRDSFVWKTNIPVSVGTAVPPSLVVLVPLRFTAGYPLCLFNNDLLLKIASKLERYQRPCTMQPSIVVQHLPP